MSSSSGERRARVHIIKCLHGQSHEDVCRETPPEADITSEVLACNRISVFWDSTPQNVLLIKKPNDARASEYLGIMAQYIREELNLTPFVEYAVREEYPDIPYATEELYTSISLIVTLGGDGTILWVSHLFPESVPPLVAFHSGTLGFLAPFDLDEYRSVLQSSLDVPQCFGVSIRNRLRVTVVRGCSVKESEGVDGNGSPLPMFGVEEELEGGGIALNEVLVERASSSIAVLESFADDKFLTTVQADGLILSTPTGSTAYNMSAGGSMAHPAVPCLLLTPICPHSLSFRPIILPDAVTVRLQVPKFARTGCRLTLDGRAVGHLDPGDSAIVRQHTYPLAAVMRDQDAGSSEWFEQLTGALNWNQRGGAVQGKQSNQKTSVAKL